MGQLAAGIEAESRKAETARLEAENHTSETVNCLGFSGVISLLNTNKHRPVAPATAKQLKYLVSAAGLEPATHALKGHCSTN
jgi:hypothetical protein